MEESDIDTQCMQEQEDEVLALQAIFEGDFEEIEHLEEATRAFSIAIHVRPPDGCQVAVPLPLRPPLARPAGAALADSPRKQRPGKEPASEQQEGAKLTRMGSFGMESFRRSLNSVCDEPRPDTAETSGSGKPPSSSGTAPEPPPATPPEPPPPPATPEDGAPAPTPETAHVAHPQPLPDAARCPNPEGTRSADAREEGEEEEERKDGAENSSSREIVYGVEYLPPMRLVCSLPRDYPLNSAPNFSLWVLWLNPLQISCLCKELDRMWEEQKGGVVLYSWTEWLRSESLAFLNVGNRIELGPYDVSGSIGRRERDPRAVPEGTSLDEDLPRLLKYNEEKKTEAFRNGIHTCFICFSEFPGKQFVRLPCGHSFCVECMGCHASMHVKEGTVHSLTCPDTTCRKILPHNLLRELLDRETYERWEEIVLQKTLDTMADLVYCPRCEQACIEEENHHAQCSHCFFSFCSLCNDTWHHLNQPCTSPEDRLRILEERERKRGGGVAAESKSAADLEREKKVKELIRNEMLCALYVRRQARQCPACKMAIEKTEGCNKMTCRNCGRYFCYKCGKSIEDYSHFRGGEFCELFENEAIVQEEAVREQEDLPDWDEELDYARLDIEAAIAVWPERVRTCPNSECGQKNLKKGNNNRIKCYFCKGTFCGLCLKVVRSPAAHFGPHRCSQHTAD